MAIKLIKNKKYKKAEVDLTGPEGNAFYLIGLATRLSKQLGKDPRLVIDKMTAGNYDNLISEFDKEFGEYVDLYR